MSKDRELTYEAAFVDKDQREAELEKDSKHRETYLENELASMCILVSKLRRSQEAHSVTVSETDDATNLTKTNPNKYIIITTLNCFLFRRIKKKNKRIEQ